MRSSKSRSRSKTNRPRTLGNIINRVFDSSGPEGKVRGTPQQIIEKYLFLARDAQLSNDRVAAENFLQHAEHYTRMLGEANRELAAEQESRQQFQPQGGQQGGNANPGQNGNGNGNSGQPGGQGGQRDREGQRPDQRADRPERDRERPERDRQDRDRPERDRPDRDRQDRDRNDARQFDRPSDRPSDRTSERSSDRAEPRGDFRPDFASHRASEPKAEPRTEAYSDPRPEPRPESRPAPLSEPHDVIDLSADRDQGLVDTPEAPEHRPARSSAPRKAAAAAKTPAIDGVPLAEPVAEPAPKPRSSAVRRPRSPKKSGDTAETGATETGPAPSGQTPREAAE